MSLEYLIVGIAKGEKSDFDKLFELTHRQVYALSLATVKDRVIAKEISVETYKRIKDLANGFDTDLNAEYWILDITRNLCINSLHDKELHEKCDSKRLDNVSKLLRDTIINTTNDRGSIILLRLLSDLSKSDIANLLWYYLSSANNEYHRGIKQLIKMDPIVRNTESLKSELRKDIDKCVPDMKELIYSVEKTMVSHISHEFVNNPDNDMSYSGTDIEYEHLKRMTKAGKANKKAKNIAAFSLIGLTILASVLIIYVIYNNYKKQHESTKYYLGTKIAIVEIDGVVYYQNYKDKSNLYSYNFKTETFKRLCNDFIKELVTDGQLLFYRNRNDGMIYRISTDGTGRQKISQKAGSCITLYKDWIYYSESTGIFRMKKDGSNRQEVIVIEGKEIFRYDIEVHKDIVYFSGGIGSGIFYVDNEGKKPAVNALYFTQAYDIKIVDDYLYFNTEIDSVNLYKLNLKDGQYETVSNLKSGTGAYYIYDSEIYMDGYVKSTTGIKEGLGVYKLGESQTPDLIISGSVSDLFVSEKYIYCYSLEKGGNLVVYNKDNLEHITLIF